MDGVILGSGEHGGHAVFMIVTINPDSLLHSVLQDVLVMVVNNNAASQKSRRNRRSRGRPMFGVMGWLLPCSGRSRLLGGLYQLPSLCIPFLLPHAAEV